MFKEYKSPSLRNAIRSASQSPAKKFFDNGGLSYGMCASAPMMVRAPANPFERKVSAARTPASDAPIMTIVSTRRGYELSLQNGKGPVQVVS